MRLLICVILSIVLTPHAYADTSGIIKVKSPYSAEDTADRFEAAIKEKGMKVFPRFDHSAAANEYGKTMQTTIVVSFGNPKYGTPFMIDNPVAGIDFPPKAIIYEDRNKQVWLAYNSAEYLYNTIFKRHGLIFKQDDIAFFKKTLAELVDKAVAQ